jgi:uncharacterized integral membrane protein
MQNLEFFRKPSFYHGENLFNILERKLVFSQRHINIFLAEIQAAKFYFVMLKMKSTMALILGVLLVLVAFQNMASVELTFLFWTFQTRRIVLIAICVITGFLLGRITFTHKPKTPEDH